MLTVARLKVLMLSYFNKHIVICKTIVGRGMARDYFGVACHHSGSAPGQYHDRTCDRYLDFSFRILYAAGHLFSQVI